MTRQGQAVAVELWKPKNRFFGSTPMQLPTTQQWKIQVGEMLFQASQSFALLLHDGLPRNT